MRVEQGFQQIPFREDNPYTSDPVLPSLLKRTIPPTPLQEIEQELTLFGEEVTSTIRALGAPDRIGPPQLVQYDQWGHRIDRLTTSEGWRDFKAFAQKEGFPAIFYERKYGHSSRTYGFAKAFLMIGDTHTIFCPLSMTDGAARLIEVMGTPAMKRDIFPRLISRDSSLAFTSGQWMTERPGGSDVSQTETVAVATGEETQYGPQYKLNGFKWFSSATDSDISVALARTGSIQDGSRGLSLFLVPLRLPLLRNPADPFPSHTSNKILIHRLKNKIGTHALATAELSLEGTEAYLFGPLNQGVKCITPVLNITRIWSAISSVGYLRKCLSIATSYATVRAIDGGRRLLADDPLHVSFLASINLLYRALTHLTFGVILLLGKSECGVASPDELRRLRLLTPVIKAFAAEKASAGMEDAMTALGGAGYMEENGLGRAIRDALVEKIWEGTATVLALDVARSSRDPKTVSAFISWAKDIIKSCPAGLKTQLSLSFGILGQALDELETAYQHPIRPLLPWPALRLLGSVASAIYLLEHAIWSVLSGEPSMDVDIEVFVRWVVEGDILLAITKVKEAKRSNHKKEEINSAMVFGSSSIRTKL
ncbi:hypothetical protein M378DRAFT_25143 [Amanita muscaria Koide BX008]|uniref:Acyl-CoA dehydrogenase n=1 Tax=Amanita muscaria (strain Koide BX008) TaxID=946122 RepID=A0A0C2T958_AMAMK|nr:hypothetical protein M378DRAFT_25143 [Amanita muscaria Koide BX008]